MLLKDDETSMRSLNRAIIWFKHFLQTTSFHHCVLWKLGDDPSRFIEWMDCCCGAGYGHVNDESNAKRINSLCRDEQFSHFKTSKACEALAIFPSSLALYSGIHGDVVMSNQPKWIYNEVENGTRVLIPITGGLIELHFDTHIPSDKNLVELIMDQCNFYSKQEPIVFIQRNQVPNQYLHTQMLPKVTLIQSNPGSSIGSTTPPNENSSPELDPFIFSSPISSNPKHNVKIGKRPVGESYLSKNLQLERNRRNRIRDGLFALRALVPNISKMDRASIIGDAIEYIGELQKNVKALRDELEELNDESNKCSVKLKGAHEGKKYPIAANYSLVLPKLGENNKKMKMQMEVNHLGSKSYLFKLTYEHKRGRFTKLMEALNSFGVQVVDCNATTFDDKVLNVFKVQANKEIQLKKLNDSLVKLLS